MNLWELGYLILACLTGALMTTIVWRSRPADPNPWTVVAVSFFVLAATALWPIAHVATLATVALGKGRKRAGASE